MEYIYAFPLIFSAMYSMGRTVIFFTLKKYDSYATIKKIYTLSFVFQFTITFLLIIALYLNFEEGIMPGVDTEGFFQKAEYLARGVGVESLHGVTGSEGIITIYSIFFILFGISKVPIVYMWFFIASFIPVISFLISDIVFSRYVAYYSSVILSLYPSLAVLSAIPHKDVISGFLLTLTIYNLILIGQDSRAKSILVYGICILGLSFVRVELVVIVVLITVIYVSLKLLDKTFSWVRFGAFVVIAAPVIAMIATNFLPISLNQINYVLDPQLFYDEIQKVIAITRARTDTSGFVGTLIHMNPVYRTILGAVVMFIKPFPPTSVLQNFDFPSLMIVSSFVIYILSPFFILGVFISFKNFSSSKAMLIVLILTIVLASGLFYAGAQIRYRMMVIPFIFMFSAEGLRIRRNYLRFIFLYYTAFLMVVSFYYIAG
jgi:hypothetical protein